MNEISPWQSFPTLIQLFIGSAPRGRERGRRRWVVMLMSRLTRLVPTGALASAQSSPIIQIIPHQIPHSAAHPPRCPPPSDRGQKRPNCHLRPGRRINQSHRRVTHIPRPGAGNQQIFLISNFLSKADPTNMGLVELDTHVGLEINPALSCNLETIPTSILGPKLGLSILFVIFKPTGPSDLMHMYNAC